MLKKSMSVILVSAMMLSAVAACHKKDNGNGNTGTNTTESGVAVIPVSGEEIVDDSAWFNVQTTTFAEHYDRNAYDYGTIDLLGFKDGVVAVMFSGVRKTSGDDEQDYSLAYEEKIDFYDMVGNLVNTVDLKSVLEESGMDIDNVYISSTTFDNEYIYLDLTEYDPDTWEATFKEARLDLATGDLVDCNEIESDGSEESSYEGSYSFDGYTVTKNFYWEDSPYYILGIDTPDGDSYDMDLRNELTADDIFDISNIIYTGNGRALGFYTSGGCGNAVQTGIIMLDLEGRHASIYEEDLSWIGQADLQNTTSTEDGRILSVGKEGLYELDFDSKTVTLLVDFNCSNVNRFDANNYSFVGENDGTYMFSGYIESDDDDDPFYYTPTLVTFEQAQSNPNAGKTYIRIAAPEGITYEQAEAVRRFNEISDDGFIIFDFSYDAGTDRDPYLDYMINTDSDEDLDAAASMSNALSIDLMTGDGPDMIFGMIGYSQLNNDNYLMDLSNLLPEGELFDNVIDAARVDGKLYQLPLDCGFAGITASGDDVGYTDAGFTFDSYGEFVDNVCNGTDPIGLGRLDYMSLCYSAMSDDFNSGSGTVDYDNEAFRSLAEFAASITEASANDDPQMAYDVCGWATEGVGYTSVYSLDDYLSTFGGTADTTRLMGIPTYEGRGPLIKVADSVGISASTRSADICREFVEFLMSYDGQMIFAEGGRTPVSVEAFEQGAAETIERYNEEVQDFLQYATRDELLECGFFAEEVDAGVIDAYEGFIRSATTIEMSDPAVIKIIREEISAYFEGQKTLDEVIEILENRVQTFMNERG